MTNLLQPPVRDRRMPPPTAPYAGSNSERQSVGDPGHCERCARMGHVKAHPDLGCGDVGCSYHHDDDSEPSAPSAPSTSGPVGTGSPLPTDRVLSVGTPVRWSLGDGRTEHHGAVYAPVARDASQSPGPGADAAAGYQVIWAGTIVPRYVPAHELELWIPTR